MDYIEQICIVVFINFNNIFFKELKNVSFTSFWGKSEGIGRGNFTSELSIFNKFSTLLYLP